MKEYIAYKIGSRYTVGIFDDYFDRFITNDGIFRSIWWDNKIDAQAAAAALNLKIWEG